MSESMRKFRPFLFFALFLAACVLFNAAGDTWGIDEAIWFHTVRWLVCTSILGCSLWFWGKIVEVRYQLCGYLLRAVAIAIPLVGTLAFVVKWIKSVL